MDILFYTYLINFIDKGQIMSYISVFDVLGPIMIGPSSSHTAGATRLAKVAGSIASGNIKKVEFNLHGSFSKTYKGHGTDLALVAGILGMDPYDENLKKSFSIAKEKGLLIIFNECDLSYKGPIHPNTVEFKMTLESGDIVQVMGSSIGGGSILITEINEESVEFTGKYPTIIINHMDTPGVIADVTKIIYDNNINVAFMKVYRRKKGSFASMIFETDTVIPDEVIHILKNISNIKKVSIIPPVL